MLRLNTFGRLFLTRDGQRLGGAAAQPRRLALLALLAASGDGGISRDRLLGLLWGESDEERARRGLNQALYALRQEMGGEEVFLGTRDLRVNPDYLTSDLAAFTTALKAGRLEQAVDEYAGPFLDGLHLSEAPEFERWVEEERAGYARDYASSLERLARQASERGDPPAAAGWWRRLAGQDPLNARVACALMEALVAAGDRPAALQHARVYEVLLAEELDAPPDKAVVALSERIRRQSASHAAFVDVPPPPPAAPAPAPAAVTEPAAPAALTRPSARSDAEPARAPSPAPSPAAAPLPRRRALLPMVGAALAGAAVAAGATFALTGDRPPPASAARILRITAEPGLEIHPALSPDGGFVAYAAGPTGRMRIYVRQLAGGRTVAVGESVKGDQHWPRWSPDGSRITFEADHAIYIAPALGGAVKALVPTPPEPPFADDEGPGSLAWSPDGERVAYVYERSIYVKPAAGGTPTRIVTVTPDPPHSLAWSPDGARIAFVLGNAAFVYSRNAIGNIAPSSIWLVRAEGGALTPVTDAAALNTSPVWMPDGGHLRFVSNRDGVRDVYEVEVRSAGAGRIRRITTGLLPHTIDVSRDGRVMVYGTFTDFANVWSLPVGSGAPAGVESARQVTVGHQSVEGLALSTDRRWLAFDSDRGGRQAIYRVSLEGGELEQLSGAEGDDFMPAWSPDGREIAYYGFRAGRRRLFVMPVDGGEPVPVVSDSGNQRFPDWSPDGRSLVFHSDHTGRFELFLVRRDAGGKWGPARQLTRDGGQEARWSPDGSAIVYVRGTGVWLVLPDGGQPRPLVDAADPATDPVPLLAQWAPDGRTVYYKALDRDGIATFWAVPAAGGRPRLVARLDDPARPSPRAEFATDGERLYFTIAERESDLWRMETAR